MKALGAPRAGFGDVVGGTSFVGRQTFLFLRTIFSSGASLHPTGFEGIALPTKGTNSADNANGSMLESVAYCKTGLVITAFVKKEIAKTSAMTTFCSIVDAMIDFGIVTKSRHFLPFDLKGSKYHWI